MRFHLAAFAVFSLAIFTPPNSFAQAPTMRVLQPSAVTVRKGAPLQIRYEIRNPPPVGSVGIFLEKHVPLNERYKYPGPSGPIMISAQNLAPKQSAGEFSWDGNTFACAPADSPMLCRTPAEPGNYVIEVILYDRKDAPLLQLLGMDPKKGPQKVAGASSVPFRIEGEPDLAPVSLRFRNRALQELVNNFSLELRAGVNMERYWTVGAIKRKQEEYCQTLEAHEPFSGALTICGALFTEVNALSVEGKVGLQAGVLPFTDARKAAEQAAIGAYRLRVRFLEAPSMEAAGFRGDALQYEAWRKKYPDASTYLERSLWRWTYRSDGGYWAFVYQVEKAGGIDNTKDHFNDLVWVRVENSGQACVVAQTPVESGVDHDIITDPMQCLSLKASSSPSK